MKKIKLKDICNISTGGTPSRSNINYWNNGDIPWCKIGDFSGKYINQVKENITEEGLKNSSAKIFKRGTILYTIFATVGEVAILETESATNQAIAGLELINNEVDLEYLYYYLKSLKFVMLKKSRGVAQNNINLGILKNIEIKIPDKMEQINIAKILANIEKVIDKKNKQLKELNTIIKSQFVEMFKNIKKYVELQKVCSFINGDRGKNYPSGDKISKNKEGVAFINAGLLESNKVNWSNMNYISEDTYNNLRSGKIQKDDILYCLRGSLGKCAIIDFLKKGAIASSLVILRANKNEINPNFLLIQLGMEEILYQQNQANNGSSQPNLSANSVKKYKILLPPITLQNQFSEIVKQIDKQKFEIEKSLKETQELYESLMEKYFG